MAALNHLQGRRSGTSFIARSGRGPNADQHRPPRHPLGLARPKQLGPWTGGRQRTRYSIAFPRTWPPLCSSPVAPAPTLGPRQTRGQARGQHPCPAGGRCRSGLGERRRKPKYLIIARSSSRQPYKFVLRPSWLGRRGEVLGGGSGSRRLRDLSWPKPDEDQAHCSATGCLAGCSR